MGDKKLFDIDEFWKDLKLDKYGIEDIDEFEIDEIGKKIEESLDLEEFEAMEDKIEMPSPETFAKWVELGEDKYRKRLRRKRILGICATLLIVCIGAVVAINCIKPPVVDAGLEGGIQIDDSMERTTTYNKWSDLPADIQDTFIEIKDLPEGYEIEKIEVRSGKFASQIDYEIINGTSLIEIRQRSFEEGTLTSNNITDDNIETLILGNNLYVERHTDSIEKSTYKFVVNNIFVEIVAPNTITENNIAELVEPFQ